MSIISALKTFIATCPSLEAGKLLLVDHADDPVSYTLQPLPGSRVVESYLNGGSLREYPFAFLTSQLTADDAERLDTAGFLETFSAWLETQTAAGTLPTLGAKQTAQAIEATGWGYLYEQGQSDTGLYQILCKLTYSQQP